MPRPYPATTVWGLPGKGLVGDQKQVERIFPPYLAKEAPIQTRK
jgi:hypothetical protein